MKRKVSMALVCAVVMTLLLAGTALAAALGVFGQLGESAEDAETRQRLQSLEQAADTVNEQVTLTAPEAAQPTAEPQTDYDRLLAHQQGKTFTLTLEQAYCDGDRLYYSYTLKHSELTTERHEGTPTGMTWYMSSPGERWGEKSSNDSHPDIPEWLDSHERSWYAFDNVALGDGAYLADGTILDIISGDSQHVDATTIRGYQEVRLPERLPDGDTLTIELTVRYSTGVVYQDETGAYTGIVRQEETGGRLRVPFTISRTGVTVGASGQGAYEEYSAQASLTVSDIEIAGTVVLDCPEAWKSCVDMAGQEGTTDGVIGYALYTADGQRLANRDGGLSLNEQGKLTIALRYELPGSTQGLRLRPEYAQSGERAGEEITLD